MEGNIGLDTPPPSRSSEFTGCPVVLTRMNSDTSSLTAENCKDVLLRLDDSRVWTNEKHNLYLEQLEVSFVTQLHQSLGIVGKFHELNQRDVNISQKSPSDAHNSSGQFTFLRNGCWQNINSERVELLSHTSADSHSLLKSPFVSQSKRPRTDCHPPSADVGEFLKISGTLKQRKGVTCHKLTKCSQQCSTSNLYRGDSFDITREGTGQNFLDGESKSNMEYQAKRFKTALTNPSILDQIVPQGPSDNKLFSN